MSTVVVGAVTTGQLKPPTKLVGLAGPTVAVNGPQSQTLLNT